MMFMNTFQKNVKNNSGGKDENADLIDMGKECTWEEIIFRNLEVQQNLCSRRILENSSTMYLRRQVNDGGIGFMRLLNRDPLNFWKKWLVWNG